MSMLELCILCVTDGLWGTGVIEPECPRAETSAVEAREVAIDGAAVVMSSDSVRRIRLARGPKNVLPCSSSTELSSSRRRITPWVVAVPKEHDEAPPLTCCRCFARRKLPTSLFYQIPTHLCNLESGLRLSGGLHALAYPWLFEIRHGNLRICR